MLNLNFVVKEEFIEAVDVEDLIWSCLEIDRPAGVERVISFENIQHW